MKPNSDQFSGMLFRVSNLAPRNKRILLTNNVCKFHLQKILLKYIKRSENIISVRWDLGFWNDFDGNVDAFEGALLGLGGAGVAEMAAAHFFGELVMGRELFGEAEALIQPNLTLAAFRYGGFVRLHGAVAPGEERANVLGRRRRREGTLEDPQRCGTHAARVWVRRRVFEPTLQRARAVEWEFRGFGGVRCCCWWRNFVREFWVFSLTLLGLDGFSMADSHQITSTNNDTNQNHKIFHQSEIREIREVPNSEHSQAQILHSKKKKKKVSYVL